MLSEDYVYMSVSPHIPAKHQTKLITYLQTLSDGNLSALSDNYTKAALYRYINNHYLCEGAILVQLKLVSSILNIIHTYTAEERGTFVKVLCFADGQDNLNGYIVRVMFMCIPTHCSR